MLSSTYYLLHQDGPADDKAFKIHCDDDEMQV